MVTADILDQISKKETQHADLYYKEFKSLSFAERLLLFKLKADIGRLSLLAVESTTDLTERGEYLRKVVRYHPFLKPNFITLANVGFADSIPTKPLPPTKKPNDFVGDGAPAGLIIPAVLLAMAATLPYSIYKLSQADRIAQIIYVRSRCLFNLDSTLTSEDCLSLAVSHLDKGNHFIAIRFLLEADIRSDTKNPEIVHYFCCAINALISEVNPISLIFPRIVEIKNRVLQGKQKPLESLLQSIWDLNDIFPLNLLELVATNALNSNQIKNLQQTLDSYQTNPFTKQFKAEATPENSNNQVTMLELCLYLRESLYVTYPYLNPSDQYNAKHTPSNTKSTLSTISLTQLVAYMSQVCDLPSDILCAGRTAHLLLDHPTDQDNQASLHLDLLFEKSDTNAEPQRTAMTFLPSRVQASLLTSSNSKGNNSVPRPSKQ